MVIVAYLINFFAGILVYSFFWIFCRSFFSANTNTWIMNIMFGVGALLLLGGFSALKGGAADGRFSTGHKGNITPDLPDGCLFGYTALNFILIGWGFVFLRDYSSISDVLHYVSITEWEQMNLFVYLSGFVFLINGFMIPISSLIMPSE